MAARLIYNALAADSFNRANESPLAAPWVVSQDAANVQRRYNLSSNQLVPKDSTADNLYRYSGVTWPNDQYSRARLTEAGSSSLAGPGLAVRISLTDDTTCYRVVASQAGSNNVELAKFVAGVYTQLSAITLSWSVGNLWTLAAIQSVIRVYYQSTLIIEVPDSSITSGAAGICHSSTSTGAVIDDWDAGGAALVGIELALAEMQV